ncbi:hypothetical protein M0R45_015345 [Rubus argutus]|uniref:Uncharacterized protein n=1 Tax=Rubus argutus TaxID=59490 RepID=A0AAW1XPU8_RUBAR
MEGMLHTSTSPLPRGVFEDLTEVRFIQWNGGVAIAGDWRRRSRCYGAGRLQGEQMEREKDRGPLQILKDEPELKEGDCSYKC